MGKQVFTKWGCVGGYLLQKREVLIHESPHFRATKIHTSIYPTVYPTNYPFTFFSIFSVFKRQKASPGVIVFKRHPREAKLAKPHNQQKSANGIYSQLNASTEAPQAPSREPYHLKQKQPTKTSRL
ncbi:MAG: hypothetical protein PHR79_05355 [Bacteroidales bacterium]|nr:hypothetical protein [Bacteroidales bacterium]